MSFFNISLGVAWQTESQLQIHPCPGGAVREIGMQLTSKFTVTKTLASDQAKLLSEFRIELYMIHSMYSILW